MLSWNNIEHWSQVQIIVKWSNILVDRGHINLKMVKDFEEHFLGLSPVKGLYIWDVYVKCGYLYTNLGINFILSWIKNFPNSKTLGIFLCHNFLYFLHYSLGLWILGFSSPVLAFGLVLWLDFDCTFAWKFWNYQKFMS